MGVSGVPARTLAGALAGIVGRDGVSNDATALAAAAVDGAVPRAVVRVASRDQVAQVLALAHDDGLAVVPRGGGNALGSGVPPARVDIVLDLRALDRVVEWNPDDLTVTVEAAVTLGALNEKVLAAHRQTLPLDPAGWRLRTVGGVTATNASGPLRARYGTMRDLLLGVRFAQSDGVTTWGGAKVVKSVTGYDVPKLMVGALGTIGVLTELTLRLHAVPESERTWLVTAPSLETLQACLDALVDSPLQPSRVEVLDTGALAGFGAGHAKAALAVAFASVAEAVREQGDRLVDMARRAGAAVTERPTDVWRDVDRIATPSSGDVALDVAALPAQVGGVIRAITYDPAVFGTSVRCAVTGHASVGTLRAIVGGAAPSDVVAMVTRLRASVADFGGSVVVSAGPRAVRAAIDPWGPIEPGAFALMRRIKQEFDPRGVLNPGRFVGGL
ncbi:MAG: FAD-binding oxidoreductase [Candidatus Rokubacteria bacterium]|nr:FAD-binding oxidoreductase [Candidatus Rokubacteria bacterium]